MSPAGTLLNQYGLPPSSQPHTITVGPDNLLWFTEFRRGRIAKMDTSGNLTEYRLAPASAPVGITVGPDGNLWFAENGGRRIGRITTGGALSEYSQNVGQPWEIVTGPDGNLWFTDRDAHTIKRMTVGGEVTTYPTPTASSGPTGITVGPDGNLWFTESFGNKIGKLIPTWELKEVAVGQDGRTRQLWVNPNGQMQVKLTDDRGSVLAQSPAFGPFYTPNNDPINGRRWRAKSIAVGPDGNSRVVWQRGDEGVEVWIIGPYGNLISKTSGGPF